MIYAITATPVVRCQFNYLQLKAQSISNADWNAEWIFSQNHLKICVICMCFKNVASSIIFDLLYIIIESEIVSNFIRLHNQNRNCTVHTNTHENVFLQKSYDDVQYTHLYDYRQMIEQRTKRASQIRCRSTLNKKAHFECRPET